MTLPTFTNSGRVQYDYALTGLDANLDPVPVPFLAGQSTDFPYLRESEKGQREQLDVRGEPGEQSLTGWWYRSQSSFDLGAGIEFVDSGTDPYLARRFSDSCGVDIFTAGQVSLLRNASLAHSTASSQALVSYSNGGEEGVLHANGASLHRVASTGTVTAVTWGGSGTILALCTDGGSYFVADSTGIYRGVLPGSAGTQIYTFGGGVNRVAMRYAKDRLIVAVNEAVYEIANTAPGSPTALPTALTTGPLNGWTWSAIVDGPDAIFLSGYAGDFSAIHAITIDLSVSPPTLAPPRVVAELPRGEVAYTIESYMGTYLVVGTSVGARIGLIGVGGRVDIGPLSLRSNMPVRAAMCRGSYTWVGGSLSPEIQSDNATLTNRHGLYRIDLSQQILTEQGASTGQFAYARDVYLPGTAAGSAHIMGVASIGQTGRTAFAINGVGVVFESASEVLPRGYLATGRVRMDTWEDKVFSFLRVTNSVTDGSIVAQWQGESGGYSTLWDWDTDTIRQVDTDGSDGLPHLFVKYRFVLERGDASTSNTPVLTGYQARVQPSNVTLRKIRLVLQCFPREKTSAGVQVERETWSRVEALERAEQRGAPIVFQDLGTGETALTIIDKVQFVSQSTPHFAVDRRDPGGLLLVTLRKIT